MSPWQKVFASLTTTLFYREREIQQYPIPLYKTARGIYAVLPAMCSRISTV
jgi:hypothetical protein